MKCVDCGLPAVTFDTFNEARCNQHATEFVPATRDIPEEDDWNSVV
jgi:hypothetical protein